MLINLSDVLSDQHKTVEETVRLENGRDPDEIREAIRLSSKEPVHVRVEHVRGKEMLVNAETRTCSTVDSL